MISRSKTLRVKTQNIKWLIEQNPCFYLFIYLFIYLFSYFFYLLYDHCISVQWLYSVSVLICCCFN
ncbi:MAG: hypothetical protein N7Q72_05480, partial [Spiroplasma sp. Tabriz.8]|nr:hypothetical protein [Spiroplasma sp. Tabriz.8]